MKTAKNLLIILLLAALLSLVLCGCINKVETNQETYNERFATEIADNSFGFTTTYIITDKDTGVQYLYVFRGDSGGITPLLNSDGTLMLNKE